MPHVSAGYKAAMAYWVKVLGDPKAPDKQKELAAREIGKLEAGRKRKRREKLQQPVSTPAPVAAPPPATDPRIQAMLEQNKTGGADELSKGSN